MPLPLTQSTLAVASFVSSSQSHLFIFILQFLLLLCLSPKVLAPWNVVCGPAPSASPRLYELCRSPGTSLDLLNQNLFSQQPLVVAMHINIWKALPVQCICMPVQSCELLLVTCEIVNRYLYYMHFLLKSADFWSGAYASLCLSPRCIFLNLLLPGTMEMEMDSNSAVSLHICAPPVFYEVMLMYFYVWLTIRSKVPWRQNETRHRNSCPWLVEGVFLGRPEKKGGK